MTMRSFPAIRRTVAAAAIGATMLLFGSAAQAQEPSYAVRQAQIVGTVRSFDGQYTMYVRDERGYLDRVQLHQGTIINPTGLTLEGGMHVTVYGRADGPVFLADEIDTPYRAVPYYGYPYAYGYPAWGVGVRFGWGGWGGGWHHHRCC